MAPRHARARVARLRIAPLHVALALALLVASLVRPAFAGGGAGAASPAAVRAVGTIGLTVADLERSLDFYQRVLGFVQTGDAVIARAPGIEARVATLRLGDETIALSEYASSRGRPVPEDARANDRDFQHVAIIVRDMARAYAWLQANHVRPASTGGPQRLPAWNAAAAGIEAFYFRDPDGHFLEVLAFPPDKGAAKWHRPGDDLFLGIDHTAIVVADTDASLRVYRDVLGMTVAGESRNHGREQEMLNGVPGARLRITTLRAPAGPGIELLEYLAPRDGRPAAPDPCTCDVVHWQTHLLVDDVAAAASTLRSAELPSVTPWPVASDAPSLGASAAVLVRDPDGHALEIAAAGPSPARDKEMKP